jgi:Domain of unknown function (DUF4386)
MAHTIRSTMTTRTPVDPMRRTALVAGLLYLLTFAASIPAVFLMGPVLTNPDYVLGAGADRQVILGAFLDIITALAGIGTAVALFSVVKRQHEGLAIGFVASRGFEAAVIAVGVVSVLAVVTLRQPGATGVEATSLVITQQALVAVKDWTFMIGPGMAGLNALLLGTLMYRSALVPRIIPTLGLIGAPLYWSAQIATMFGFNETTTVWSGVGLLPIFVWELSLGLWMTFKGFRKDAPLMVQAAAEATGVAGTPAIPSSVSVAAGAGVA